MIGARYDYESEGWRDLLTENGLHGFDDVWNLPHVWVQKPNGRHGGFAGVARHELIAPDGRRRGYYIKIHVNRLRRTPARPWLGTPVLTHELRNHWRCARLGIESSTPVYCANRRVDGMHRGILVTEELTTHRPLTDLLEAWEKERPAPAERRLVIDRVAAALRTLHDARLRVAGFSAEHIFVRIEGDDESRVSIRLVDLERLRISVFPRLSNVRDLATLHRTTPQIRLTERLRFLASYLGEAEVTPAVRNLWKRAGREAEARQRRNVARRPRTLRKRLRMRLGLREDRRVLRSRNPTP